MKSKISIVINLFKKNTFLFSLLITTLFILFSVGLSWEFNKLVLSNPDPLAHYLLEPNNPLKFLSNWDGPQYLRISKNGYTDSTLTKFLPLYPILVHAFNYLIPSTLIAALLISWVCLVFSIYFYLKIVDVLFGVKNNLNRFNYLIFYIFFPSGIFFVATYSESLFAMLALGAVYLALKNRYILAGILSSLFLITNTYGFLTLLFILLILFEQKQKIVKLITYLGISLIGIIGYSIYLLDKFNSPLAFILSQKSNGWLNGHFTELVSSFNIFTLVFIILLILGAIYWYKKRKSFSIYLLSFLLIPILGNQFGGFNRYVLMAFPLQFMAYDYLKNKALLQKVCLIVLIVTWTYFSLQYGGGYIGG